MLLTYPHVDVLEWVDRPVRGLRSRAGIRSGRLGFDLQPGQRIWRVGYIDPESGRLCERWQYVTVATIDAEGVTVLLEPEMRPKHLPWRVVRRFARRVPGRSEGYDYRRDKPYAWTGSIVPEEGERVLCFEPLPILSGTVALETLLEEGIPSRAACSVQFSQRESLGLAVYDAFGRCFSETIYNANLAYFLEEEAAGAAGESKAG